MTYEQFLQHLRKSRRLWAFEVVSGAHWIVSKREGHSPLTAVAAKITGKSYRKTAGRHRAPMFQGLEAAEDIGLPDELRCEIENATMGYRGCGEKKRREILAACRLEEPRDAKRLRPPT